MGLKDSQDRLSRVEITAPIAGTVFGLSFNTTGGVIKPGEAILDIVPARDELVIDAKVRPQDVDELSIGQEAYVILSSIPQRNLPRLTGRLVSISADAFEDERTGMHYYEVEVEIDRTALEAAAPDVRLTPGMPAEVYVATKARTVLAYLVDPLRQTIERAFREQ
jgi:HlyD family secretion protein/epimerase transport system membrane fusion protein